LAAADSSTTDGGINATILDMLLAHGADIEERCLSGLTPLYRAIMHIDFKVEWAFDQAEVRLLLERCRSLPFANHVQLESIRYRDEGSARSFRLTIQE
jgi:hypothetical protein